MPPEKVCKTVHQYNSKVISGKDMEKLQEIADDYNKVKNYVYARFGGINSLSKIYPGYTVQNEMIETGLRNELELPFVYFNLAVFEAIGNIKSQWTKTKTAVLKRVNSNEGFTDEEKHYLRYLLKVSNAFEEVLNHKPVKLKAELQEKYEQLSKNVNTKKLNNYLCRQVRSLHVKQYSENADGFSLTERAYRYGNHGIYITIKEKRKRVFIPLTDNNQYNRQIGIKLYPQEGNIEINVPIDVKIQRNKDYKRQTGLALGMYTMLTTDEGHVYGERLGEYQIQLSDWIREQAVKHKADKGDLYGRKKYTARKHRMTEQMHSYINMELNRFLKTEKPAVIFISRLPPPKKHEGDKAINHSVNLWQRGYIKNRLYQKCQEKSVKVVEVFGKGISSECSRCGADGYKREGTFICQVCGYQTQEKHNAAQNIRNRGKNEM